MAINKKNTQGKKMYFKDGSLSCTKKQNCSPVVKETTPFYDLSATKGTPEWERGRGEEERDRALLIDAASCRQRSAQPVVPTVMSTGLWVETPWGCSLRRKRGMKSWWGSLGWNHLTLRRRTRPWIRNFVLENDYNFKNRSKNWFLTRFWFDSW